MSGERRSWAERRGTRKGLRHALVGSAVGTLLTFPGSATAATFTVTNTNNSGAGSLRAAITAANGSAGADLIRFSLPGAGLHTITLTSSLPTITEAVTIDGRSQPGFAGAPVVGLDGAGAVTGLRIAAGSSKVYGLAITDFTDGIKLETGSGNRIAGNWLGVTPSGAAAGNTNGITILASASNVVGGTTAADRNVMSGNDFHGVRIESASSNIVRGNYIGTDTTGASALPNGSRGVWIGAGSTGNTIGGTASGTGNVLSGNSGSGVTIVGSGTSGNFVVGNKIGTNPAGSSALGNGNNGISVFSGATQNTIGGGNAAARNTISGNTWEGVSISGAGTNGNRVLGNYIGTNAAGTGSIPNLLRGVAIFGGASGNTIGGGTASARNVISGNAFDGVLITDPGTSGNVIAANYVGIEAGGSASLRNSNGVTVTGGATGNTIGGTSAGWRNVISGNTNTGVRVTGTGTSSNLVQGNYIGTNATGAAAVPNESDGVVLTGNATQNTIGGTSAGARNVISGNRFTGITFAFPDTSGNLVQGNYIGTDASGTSALANMREGVLLLHGSGNTIGGTSSGARNIISGNGLEGIELCCGATSNLIAGNYIGTDATGSNALGNAQQGIILVQSTPSLGATDNTIGGTGSGARNVISGNVRSGIQIIGTAQTGNVIRGNYIGIDAAGTSALGNGLYGVGLVNGASSTIIGGTTVSARNVISANAQYGVAIGVSSSDAPPSNDNLVQGNFIGTDAAGTGALGNSVGGVLFDGGTGNVIGGTAASAANRIAFNNGIGVTVDGALIGAFGLSILRNSIFSNSGLGIALLNGGNHSQPAPTVTAVGPSGSQTKIDGALGASAPSTQFRIEVFVSPACDPSGAGEGTTFLKAVTITTDSSGAGVFTVSVPTLASGQAVTATATNLSTADTSQFSVCAAS